MALDALHEALKRKMDLLREKKHADGSGENQEGGVTENIMDPDEDDSDHAPDLEELSKKSGDEGVDNDPVSAHLQKGLEKGMDDEHGAHGSMADEQRHMEMLKKMMGGGEPDHGEEGPMSISGEGPRKGLRERGMDKMKEHLAQLRKKSGMGQQG